MKRGCAALVLMLAALPAAAKDYDLGYARTGMMLGQFRFAAWPAGLTVRCSDDPDRPRDVDRLLGLSKQIADLGAVRCALLKQDDAGRFHPATRRIGGSPVEISATFAPDHQGTKRLVQLFLQAPREGFDGLVAHFTSRLGQPVETGARYVRWRDPGLEAMVLHEEGDTALGIIIDQKMQAAMNTKVQGRN